MTVLTPGAGVLVSVTAALRHGIRYAWPAMAGNTFGVVVISLMSAAGLGAVIVALPQVFHGLQVAGALYLVYLGAKNWRSSSALADARAGEGPRQTQREIFLEASVLQAVNPMLFVFLLSLFPQFVDPERPFAPQAAVLLAIFWAEMVLGHTFWQLVATYARSWLKGPVASRWIGRVSGTLFILCALGVFAGMASGG